MDYKYIEQLLERYWQCETSLEEEKILRAFFSQKEVPVQLLPYKDLFTYEQTEKEMRLGKDFDEKVLSVIEGQMPVKAKRISLTRRFMPLLKAVAVVAIFFTMGNIAQHSFDRNETSDYNYDTYQDTYSDPQTACDQVNSALQLMSTGLQEAQLLDSLQKVKEGLDSIQ